MPRLEQNGGHAMTDKKQTAEEWLVKERNKYYPNNYTDQQAFEAVKMARAEEREKFDRALELSKLMGLALGKTKYEKGRREEREKVLSELGVIHGKDAERFWKETKLKAKP
jgi:ferric-dicitrate binding protein FerR (iron transport regulator)